jgi:gas vesicle protein
MALSDDPEVKRRQLAAIYAKGGFGYGGGHRSGSGLSFGGGAASFLEGATIGASVGAASIAVPQVATAYSVYKGIKLVKELYDAYRNSPQNKTSHTLDKICQEATSSAAEKVSEKTASEISSEIRKSAENSGTLSNMAMSIGVSESILGTMMEKSVNGGIVEGVGNFTSYVIEGIAM